MSLRTLERAILQEVRLVAKRPDLKLKHVMEWQTGPALQAQEGEALYYLPVLHISVVVNLPQLNSKGKTK
jgi:hypothetical protein